MNIIKEKEKPYIYTKFKYQDKKGVLIFVQIDFFYNKKVQFRKIPSINAIVCCRWIFKKEIFNHLGYYYIFNVGLGACET